MSAIRVTEGYATVEVEAFDDVRTGGGVLVAGSYPTNDLLLATFRALQAAGDRRAPEVLAMVNTSG